MKKFIFISKLIFFLLACEDAKKSSKIGDEKPVTLKAEKVKDTLYGQSKFNLPDSNIYFDVEITKVDIKERKNYFASSDTKYSVPNAISGYEPIIHFKITNPYDKEFNAPIPKYYYMRSESSHFLNLPDVGYNKKERYHYRLSDELNDKNGKLIIAGNRFGGKIINFKPKESKEFRVLFNPVTAELGKFKFGGFHKEYKGFNNINRSSNIQEIWFEIDLSRKKVTGKSISGGYKTY